MMSDSYSSYTYSDVDTQNMTWIERFCASPENLYMCEVDEEYIRDAFNLYGLDSDCPHYKKAISMILGSDESSSDSDSVDVDTNTLTDTAEYLYGMIHARYIISLDGLEAMLEKFKSRHFGVCPRVFCHEQPLLPVGLSDKPNVSGVKLFYPCCKEVYNPPEELGNIDGAFFGTTFPHMFLLQYPEYLSSPSDSYNPTIFGYRIHPSSPFYTQSANNKRTESDCSE